MMNNKEIDYTAAPFREIMKAAAIAHAYGTTEPAPRLILPRLTR